MTTPYQTTDDPRYAGSTMQDPKTDPAVRMGYTGAAGQQFAAPMKQQAVPYEERSDTVNTYNDVMPGPNQTGRQFGPPIAADAMLGPPPSSSSQPQRGTESHAPQLATEVAHEAADRAQQVTPAGKQKAAEDAASEPTSIEHNHSLVSQKIQQLTGTMPQQGEYGGRDQTYATPNASSAQVSTPMEQFKASVTETGQQAKQGVQQASSGIQQTASPVMEDLKATFTGAKEQTEGNVHDALTSSRTAQQMPGVPGAQQQSAETIWDKTVNLVSQGKEVVVEQASAASQKVGELVQQAVGSPRAANAQTRTATFPQQGRASAQAVGDQTYTTASNLQQGGTTAAQKAQEAAALTLQKAQEVAAAASAAAQKYGAAAVQSAQQTGVAAGQAAQQTGAAATEKVDRDIQPAIASGLAGWKEAVVHTVSDIAKQREQWYQEYEKDMNHEYNSDNALHADTQGTENSGVPDGKGKNVQDIAAEMYRKGYEKGLREAGLKPEDAASGHLLGVSTVGKQPLDSSSKPLLPSPDEAGLATSAYAVPALEDVIDVHAVNDVVMWRNPVKSAAVLAAGTLSYFLLARSHMNVLPIVAYALLFGLLGTTAWNLAVRLAKRSDLEAFTTFRGIPEGQVYNTIAQYKKVVNPLLATLYRGMQGMHWFDTAKVLGVLYVVRRMIPFLTSPGLLYFTFLLAFVLPKLYASRKGDIDAAFRQTKVVVREQYCTNVEPLMERVPRASTATPMDVGQPCRQ